MRDYDDTNAIWPLIQRAEILLDHYGYYPTFHDAHVVSIAPQSQDQSVSIVFEYSDLVGTPPYTSDRGTFASKIVLKWKGVTETDLDLYGNDIHRFSIERIGQLLRTEFRSGWGISGHIVSKDIEVISIEPSERDSYPDKSAYLNTVKITFH